MQVPRKIRSAVREQTILLKKSLEKRDKAGKSQGSGGRCDTLSGLTP